MITPSPSAALLHELSIPHIDDLAYTSNSASSDEEINIEIDLLNSNRHDKTAEWKWQTTLHPYIKELINPNHKSLIRHLAPLFKDPESEEIDWEFLSREIARCNQGHSYSPDSLKEYCLNLPTPTFPEQHFLLFEKDEYIEEALSSFMLWTQDNAAHKVYEHTVPPSDKQKKEKFQWTPEKDKQLLDIVASFPSSNIPWHQVASTFEDDLITARRCQNQYLYRHDPTALHSVPIRDHKTMWKLCHLFLENGIFRGTKLASFIKKND